MWDPNEKISEQAILIGIDNYSSKIPVLESLDELRMLAETAGAEVVGTFKQRRLLPHNTTYIGKGKLAEIKDFVILNKVNLVIIDDEITANQESTLAEEFGCKVIDRTRLILDIFALHASSRVGKLQVELAQMEYYAPRLNNLWEKFSRLGGGIGTRGPGEKKIEHDRRIITDRVTLIKKKLETVVEHSRSLRHRRNKAYKKNICLIGYTNAGKSTLMKKLTGADVLVADKLFATLSPTTRQFKSGKYELLLTDTVGFIRKLPHQLVKAFMATLEQVQEADLLLHVIDISAENYRHQINAVENVLSELKASEIPIIKVYNKIDLFDPKPLDKDSSDIVYVSASKNLGFDSLKTALENKLDMQIEQVQLKIPQSESKTINAIYENSNVTSRNFSENEVILTSYMEKDMIQIYKRYLYND